jgi:hypothetical protein
MEKKAKGMNFEKLTKPTSRGVIKTDGEKKPPPVYVSLTREEREKLQEKMRERGIRARGTFVRMILKENDCI